MLAYCVKDGKDQDSDEFLGLYLDALDEELADLRTLIDAHKPAFASSVKELGEEFQSAEGQTKVGERDYTVGSFFFLSLHAADVYMDTNRQILPSRAYSVEGPVRPYVRLMNPTPSPSSTGDYSDSTSRSVSLPHMYPYD